MRYKLHGLAIAATVFGLMTAPTFAADIDPTSKGAAYVDEPAGTVQVTDERCDEYSTNRWCNIFNADGGDGPGGDGCDSGGEAS